MKISKELAYTLWSAAIVLCVALSLFALIFASCAKQEGKGKAAGFTLSAEADAAAPGEASEAAGARFEKQPLKTVPEAAEPTAAPAAVRLGLTADAGRAYLDQLIFLGDSTTYGIGYYYDQGYTDLCPPKQVWTPTSGTLTLSYYNVATIFYPDTGEELTITEAVGRKQPAYLVITLGVNGVSFMDEEWFIRDYTALVQNIRTASPDTRIILNSIYPVAASYRYQNEINNERIRAANVWVERIAEATGCRFLYSYEAVVGDDGFLPESLQTDGIHMNGEGYTMVMEYIRTHAWED